MWLQVIMTMNRDSIGPYVRELRESRGLGVNQLALKAGVSNAEVSRIENGERKRPHPDTLIKIAAALRHPVEDFYERLGYLRSANPEAPSPIFTRAEEFAESQGIDLQTALCHAGVTKDQLESLDPDDPDPRILWPVAQALGTSMAYLTGKTDRPQVILGPGQAAHDTSRLHRPGDDIDPEDAWDLEQAYLEVKRRREERKKR